MRDPGHMEVMELQRHGGRPTDRYFVPYLLHVHLSKELQGMLLTLQIFRRTEELKVVPAVAFSGFCRIAPPYPCTRRSAMHESLSHKSPQRGRQSHMLDRPVSESKVKSVTNTQGSFTVYS